jgi:dihydrolipoamide dehydrogenase
MDDLGCDVAIIGAGTAGLAAERAARKAGAKTLLIDDRFAGTTCASVGCMPSKLLIAAADAAFNARKASTFGIETKTSVDGRAVMARVRKERDGFVAATLKSIEKIPAGICIRQRARFSYNTTLTLDDGRKVSAKAIVIATGSGPSVPKPFQKLGEIVLTNETIFELESLPRSIAVVGVGPLGLELAQALARLGVEVTMFDQGEHIAALRDAEVANNLKSVLGREFPIHLGVSLDVEKDGDGARLSWSGASSGAASFERVLVAAGRPPALRDLNLAATGLETNDKGIPEFDPSTLQCGDAPIFVAGDADAQRPVLHEASSEGAISGRNAASFPNVRKSKRAVPLSIMFTDPPLAMVGANKSDAMVVGSAFLRRSGSSQGGSPQRRPCAHICRLGYRHNRRGDPLRAGHGPYRTPLGLGDRAEGNGGHAAAASVLPSDVRRRIEAGPARDLRDREVAGTWGSGRRRAPGGLKSPGRYGTRGTAGRTAFSLGRSRRRDVPQDIAPCGCEKWPQSPWGRPMLLSCHPRCLPPVRCR